MPKNFDALHLLGILAVQTGEAQRGIELISKAIKLDRNFAVAHDNLGNALQAVGRLNDALASHEKAIALKPDYAAAYFNRGNVLKQLERLDEALASYQKAIALNPNFAHHLGIANVFREHDRCAEAEMHIKQALALKPDSAAVRFNLCMVQLPYIYMAESEISERRAAYQECLEALCDDVYERRIASDWANAVGLSQPFFLTYQGYNDRDLNGRYGSWSVGSWQRVIRRLH